MDKTTNTNFSCDIETGICSPNEAISQDINSTVTSKPKLIYYYDALCGWCYGFSPVITKLKENYKDQINFEVISGGLFLGDRIGPINDIAPYIRAGAYKNVESLTGVKFGTAFLDDLLGDGKMVLNSLLPSIALCIVKEKFPERELEFAELLLKAIYHDGLSSDNVNGLAEYASKVGFEKTEFITKMKSVDYKNKAEKEFEVFKSSSFSGMPTLVLENEGNQILLSNGYVTYDDLRTRLEGLLIN